MSRSVFFFAAAIALLSLPIAAQTRQKIDISKLGPQVGEKVPDFSLKDQNGNIQTLASVMGAKGAMLVFVRSADWCPYCKTQLVELQSQLSQLKARGLGVASISYDSEAIIAAFSKQRGITYPMLADVGSATIKKYGILNPLPELALSNPDDPELKAEVAKYATGVGVRPQQVGIAFPGAFFVDHNGRVTARFFEDTYYERNTVSNILVKMGATPAIAATKTSTAHLDVTAFLSDASLAAGNHFSVVLDVEPHAHLHVYAPGAEKNGYRVVAFKLDPHPQVHELAVHYPESEIYEFKPLHESVPVYQKPFRLTQELVLDGSPAGQQALKEKDSITVSGSLQYQACNDKMCFNPISVPLSWNVSLRSLLRDAPAAPRETSSVAK